MVYVLEERGKQSLHLYQIVAGSTVQILPFSGTNFGGTTFSPDGNYIYYTVLDHNNPKGALYKIPTLGDIPKKLLTDIDSAVALNPDGTKIAFLRSAPENGEQSVYIADSNGSNPVKLTSRIGLEYFLSANSIGPSWSPNGRTIAIGAGSSLKGFVTGVLAIDVESGKQSWIGRKRWDSVNRVVWAGDQGLYIVARDQKVSENSQLWYLTYPSGKVSRVTNDLNNYGSLGLSITANSKSITSTQMNSQSNIWRVDLDSTDKVEKITSDNTSGFLGVDFAAEGKIAYAASERANTDLYLLDENGNYKKRLTSHTSRDLAPSVSRRDDYIIFVSERTGTSHIWRVDFTGGNIIQLTDQEDYQPCYSPDGKWVVYAGFRTGKRLLWRIPVDGGVPQQLSQVPVNDPVISPDNKKIACRYLADPDSAYSLAILPIDGGEPEKIISFPPEQQSNSSSIRWSPDQKSILYVDSQEGYSNIWRLPLDGSVPEQITNFNTDNIHDFDISVDGRSLICARGSVTSDIILFSNLD